MFLIGFPLLLVPFAVYNIVAFLMPGVSWTGTLATVHMKSGADWAMPGGGVLVAFGMLLLFVEMAKVTRLGRRSVVDHGLAFVLFAGMTAEFILVSQAASATFFLLLVLSFLDVLGGFIMPRGLKQRGFAVHPESSPPRAAPEPAPAEPQSVAPAEPVSP